MKPLELLERLRVLSKCTGQAQTVLVVPGLPHQAASYVNGLTNSRMEGHVSARDLQDFIEWVELQSMPLVSHDHKA